MLPNVTCVCNYHVTCVCNFQALQDLMRVITAKDGKNSVEDEEEDDFAPFSLEDIADMDLTNGM